MCMCVVCARALAPRRGLFVEGRNTLSVILDSGGGGKGGGGAHADKPLDRPAAHSRDSPARSGLTPAGLYVKGEVVVGGETQVHSTCACACACAWACTPGDGGRN